MKTGYDIILQNYGTIYNVITKCQTLEQLSCAEQWLDKLFKMYAGYPWWEGTLLLEWSSRTRKIIINKNRENLCLVLQIANGMDSTKKV